VEQYFVDIWHADLRLDSESLSNLSSALDELEKQKSDTFKLPMIRDRYMAVRAISRHVLASYSNHDPARLQFTVGEHGKPGLVGQSLHFNISHSDHLLLMAVANFPDIGVDIEVIKPRINLDGLARRCFSVSELAAWQSAPKVQSKEVFYRLWTKKEAFVKAIGRGIAMGLDQCEMDWEVGGQLLSIPAAYGLANDWKVIEIPVAASICATLITPNYEFSLYQKQFVVPA